MATQTTKEAAAEIRKQLKAKGWSSRQVSVRADIYSLGSSIRVLIRDARVPKAVVKEIAEEFQRVSYDEATGEILSGGNRFVEVDFAGEALAPMISLVVSLLRDGGEVVEIAGLKVAQDTEERGFWRAWGRDDVRPIKCWGKEFCARQVVEAILASGGTFEQPEQVDPHAAAFLHMVGEVA